MTIRKRLEEELEAHGLWPDEAMKVVESIVSDDAHKMMKGRWGEDQSNYPVGVMAALWIAAKRKAVEYIDAEKPKHFARMALVP